MTKNRVKKELPPRWGEFVDFDALKKTELQDGTFTVSIEEGRFDCLLLKKPTRRLFVLLSAAHDTQRYPLPYFDRWSWSEKFPGSVLCISDPTLYLAPEELRIGWYIGTREHDWMEAMASLVKMLAGRLGISISNVICYGSSAGGFASLLLATRLGGATAVAINPQTDIFQYSKRFVDAFLRTAFEGVQADKLIEEMPARFSAIAAFRNSSKAKCLIVQNTLDRSHFKRHFSPFCNAFQCSPANEAADTGRIMTKLYRSESGHVAEPREMVPEIVDIAIRLSERLTDKPELNALTFRELDILPPLIRCEQLYIHPTDLLKTEKSGLLFALVGRTDVPPINMALPFDWSTDPYKDNNWCAQLQKWNMLDAYILSYEKDQDAVSLETVKSVMLDWYRHHVAENRESPMMWRDFVAGIRSMKLAYLISNWQHGKFILNATEQRIFLHLTMLHLDFILEPKNIKFTNHTFSDFHGAMALSEVIDQTSASEVERFILSLTPRLIATQFDQHGVHLEHSFGYQGFGIRCLKRLDASGWFTQIGLHDFLQRAESIEPLFRLPDGRVAPIGDTDGKPMPLRNKATVFKGEREIFNKSGYLIIRSDGKGVIPDASYFSLMGAFHSNIHKHPDDLSVIWFEGEDILCDAGKYAYKSSKYRKYVQSTRAHNTVEIDGNNFSVEREDAYGSAIKSVIDGQGGCQITASVHHMKIGVRHTRHCIYEPGKWLLIIDRLKSADEHNFTQWFHFSPHLVLKSNDKAFTTKLTASGRVLSVQFDTSLPSQIQLISGQDKPFIQGWISQSYAEITPSPTIGLTQRGADLTFAAFFCIDGKGSQVSIKKNGIVSLEIRQAERREKFEIAAGMTKLSIKKPEALSLIQKPDSDNDANVSKVEQSVLNEILLSAKQHTKLGKYEEAIHLLKAGTPQPEISLAALAALADVEQARRNWLAGAEYLQRAVALPGGLQDQNIVRKLGFVLRKLKRHDESDVVLRQGGVIDAPIHVRTFKINGEQLRLEIYPILVNGKSAVFLDHHAASDTVLVKLKDGLFISRDGAASWSRLPLSKCTGVTAAHIVDDSQALIYNSTRRTLDLYSFDGQHLMTHSAPYPWHGSWGIGQEKQTIVYAEYDIHAKYLKDEEPLPIRRVFRSADGGLSWKVVLAFKSAKGPDQKIRHFHAVQPDPYRPGTWYLSSGDSIGQCHVWRSEDDAEHWTEISAGGVGAIDPRIYRFTSLQFSKEYIYWGTDDLLGKEYAQAVRVRRDKPFKVELLGPIGNDKSRALVATEFGYLAISQAKDNVSSPQVYLSLVSPEGRIEHTDPILCARPSSVTFSCASKQSVNGKFFTRGQKGSLGESTETYLWRINRKILLEASSQCNLCSSALEQAIADGLDRSITETSNIKLWNALRSKKNDAHCPTCFSRARVRTLAAVFSQVVKKQAVTGPAIMVSASQKECDIISTQFSPLTNVTLYGSERYPNSVGGIDITCMPSIQTSSYSLVYAMGVFDFVPNLAAAFSEVWRVLEPSGILLFMIQPWRLEDGDFPPKVLHSNALSGTNRYDRTSNGETGIPHCIFSNGWIVKELEQVGFEVRVINQQDPFSGIKHKWYVCRKPAKEIKQ
jgi:hypothetical protein